MLKRKVCLLAGLAVMLVVGCGVITKDPVKRKGLRYDPVIYEQLDRNGTVVYRLSPEGKAAIEGDDNRFDRGVSRRWWQIW